MITKIEIENIPPFKDKITLETNQKVNLIYGLNGTGKTTLSNLLYSKNQIDTIGFKVDYDIADSHEIITYNQKFVKDNFYESSEIKGIFSLSKDNKDAQKAIDKANKEKELLQERKNNNAIEQQKISLEQKKANSVIQDKVWEIKTKYSGATSSFDYCLTGLKGEKNKLYDYINRIQKSEPPKRTIEDIQSDISTLQQENASPLTLLPRYELLIAEIENNPIFTKVIVGNENSSVSHLIDTLKNSDWVSQGLKFIDVNKKEEYQQCPFCQQKTITDDFVRELEAYFGGQYEKDIALLKTLLEQYRIECAKIVCHDIFENGILSPLKLTYETTYRALVSTLNSNIKTIEHKIINPSLSIQLLTSAEYIKTINGIIEEANKKIEEYNQRITQKEATLNELKNEFWIFMRWKYDSDLITHLNTTNKRNERINVINKENKELDAQIKEQNNIIEEYQRKTINIEDAIKNINSTLIDMGISDFKIIKYSDNLYKLSREGQKGNIFESLSEGEKMIISLLYFIERCKGKFEKEEIEKKKIIVIDDPISSLSHIYVYNVGRLIIQEFTDADISNKNVCKYEQVFLLTHSLYFFYEMAITKRKGKEDFYNQKLFRIQKNQQGSHILEMQYSEIQNDYQAYWMIIKDTSSAPALIANCMRNIIEYFFAFIEKRELNNVFQKKELNLPRFRAFNRYINRESHSLGHNIFDIKEFNYDDFKEAFKLVFTLTGYEQHYIRMMQ